MLTSQVVVAVERVESSWKIVSGYGNMAEFSLSGAVDPCPLEVRS